MPRVKFFRRPRPVGRLLPNVITLLSLCLGLTAWRWASSGEWTSSLLLLLIAGICDGMDGRLARFLRSATDLGAELDSLADFVNFGVTPAMILYLHSLHQSLTLGWMMCLVFAACSALRLARFNVGRYQKTQGFLQFSVGLPAPAAAFISLMPLMMILGWGWNVPVEVTLVFQALSSALMVSRWPLFVLKNRRLSLDNVRWLLVGAVFIIGALLVMPWTVFILSGFVYLGSIPWCIWKHHRRPLLFLR